MNETNENSLRRRTLLAATAGLAAAPVRAQGTAGGARRTVFYAAVGANLLLFDVDADATTLSRVASFTMPEAVQYIWMHPILPLMYVAFSNRYSTKLDNRHGVAVYAVNRADGRLEPFGEPVLMPNRPVHLTLDPAGRHLLVACNLPAELWVYRLGADGALGRKVDQRGKLDFGVYAHQVRVAPSGHFVVLSTRGNDPTLKAAEDPGALKVFGFQDGQLTHEMSVANGTGLGFGPRHVDFHPSLPRMYVSMERNNQLLTYATEVEGISSAPLYTASTVKAHAEWRLPVQFVGPIHVHPGGRFIYLANRSDGLVDVNGRKVHGEGDNSVAVFGLDPASGEPTLLQTIGTQSFHCRTFSIDPSGRMLVTAAVAPLDVLNDGKVEAVPAALSVFAVGDDGRLRFILKYDMDVGTEWLFWCGMLAL